LVLHFLSPSKIGFQVSGGMPMLKHITNTLAMLKLKKSLQRGIAAP
jgi:hypothetical protein